MESPTAFGRGRRAGFGNGDGRPQGTSCHSGFGYEAVKQPFLGAGVRAIAAPQALRLSSSSADGCDAGLGAGVGAVVWARAAMDDIGPASRLAANMMLRHLAMRPRAEPESVIGRPPTNEPGAGPAISRRLAYWLQNVRVTVALTAGCWDPAAGFWPVTTAELHGMDDGTA
jgi:hypothetical protein